MADGPEGGAGNPAKVKSATKANNKTASTKKAASGKRRRPKTAAGRNARSQAIPSVKGSPWTFPKNSLEDAIQIARAIEDKNAGNPMPSDTLAIAVGFRLATDWRYGDLLRSANQYGLVTGSGITASVALTDLGRDVVAPSSPTQRAAALLNAFRTVKDFAAVQDFYSGKRIPEDEFFLNTLTREFTIPRDRVDAFARIFVENLNYLRAFNPSGVTSDAPAPVESASGTLSAEKVVASSREPRVREFLDTCFVMMPFGPWMDRYYQDIYSPAIREAGFEPVRGDELFSTGSVVEQIWEQIEKAPVLLADLSGKNANVFYELGLAHAARKPVVFTASTVEDVPFDLRHLRVIIYDVREPEWSKNLRQSITDYLRNAAKEPEKSIPHPFRRLLEDASTRGGRNG